MKNKAMEQKLQSGEAIDVSGCPRWGKFYEVSGVFRGQDSGVDYCDAKLEEWIWTIGKHKVTRKIYASLGSELYQNPDIECLWLR